jgi:serine protease Do
MSEKRVKAMNAAALMEFMRKALSGIAEMVETVDPLDDSATPKMTDGESSKVLGALAEQDQEILAAVKPSLDRITPTVVSLMDGRKTLALGNVIRDNGFILTKHSEIAKTKGTLRARLSDGRDFTAVEVQQFPEYDLALVKIAANSLPAITVPELDRPLTPGSLLFTPSGSAKESMLAMGVVSVKDRSLKESGGYLGVGLNEVNGGVEIGEVVPGGPAAKAGLQRKDQILSIDDLQFHKSLELGKHIRSLKPQAHVQLKYRRGNDEKTVEVTLGDRSNLPGRIAHTDRAARLGTEISERRGGYPLIFQHDQPLNPEDCGSVIVDLHGGIAGVNIARVGRVDTYAIPSGTVAGLLKLVNFDELEKKATAALENPPKS